MPTDGACFHFSISRVVVNKAILIVHQALNFIKEQPDLDPQTAIIDSVRSRFRPILMSTLTSVGGMLPLVCYREPALNYIEDSGQLWSVACRFRRFLPCFWFQRF